MLQSFPGLGDKIILGSNAITSHKFSSNAKSQQDEIVENMELDAH